VIGEPVVRDTAGAIALAATVLAKYDSEAVMALLTADQIIEPPEVLQQALKDASTFLSMNPEALVTFGIKPTFPSTQLGYIKCADPRQCPKCRNTVYSVEAFKEKPDQETARRYIESGEYSWNSGMFVWRAKTILARLQKFLPEATEPLRRIGAVWDTPLQEKTLQEWFPKLPKISIDYAVMEKADQVHAIQLDCQWLDMGSFAALADVIKSDENNNIVVAGASELLDCRNNIIVTEDKGHLIAAIGLEDIVVAHTPDATLVCHLSQTERLKTLLDQIEKHGRTKFL
jgi:mannose-1-phosphate guanylyltransferase